jgi:DNA replication protein DnaC
MEKSSQPFESLKSPQRVCEICDGLGWISPDVPQGDPLFGKLVPCPHRNNETDRSKIEQISNELGPLGDLTLENFVPVGHAETEEQRNSLLAAVEAARRFITDPRGWLLFQGTYGCGKTHLAAAIANACLDLGFHVKFVNTADLLDYLRGAYSPSAEETFDFRFNEVRDTPILILDDLGAQNSTQWAQEKLYQILNTRYINKKPTVITTNLDLNDMEPRIRSRLSDLDLVRRLHISAPDFRRSVVEQEKDSLNQLYFHSNETFSTFSLRSKELQTKAEQDNLRQAVAVAKNYAANPKDLLVFTGGIGCGKTHLAAAIANELKHEYLSMFIFAPDLFDYLRAGFHPDSRWSLSLYKRFDEIRKCSLLILDGLGKESATPWVTEKLYQIINYRYMARLPTVITTALSLNQIDPHIQLRILDETRCTICPIIVPNYLGIKIVHEPQEERASTNKKYGRKSSS